MRPLKLEFCGINSFSEHTIIDFERLIKGGLFGIFGDTGSGKSTILDSINFALYGDVERSKGKTDIINYRCGAAEVIFTFDVLSAGKRKIYTVERVLKNDKSGTHKAMLYETDGGKQVCIADKATSVQSKITEILGVSAEDFRKCIALPQGEFAQFVKSTPSERLALIERLFDLRRYGDGLKAKIGERQNQIEQAYQNIQGKLSNFTEATEQALEEEERKFKINSAKLESLKAERETAEREYERVNALYEKRRELNETQAELGKLSAARGRMEELRKVLKALPKCAEIAEKSARAERKSADVTKFENDLKNVSSDADRQAERLEKAEKGLSSFDYDDEISRLTALTAKYESCAGKPEKLNELNLGLKAKRGEYKKLEGELNSLNERLKTADADLSAAEKLAENAERNGFAKLLNIDLKGAMLRGEYAYVLEIFSGMRGGIKKFQSGEPLYEYVSGETEKYIKEYSGKLEQLKDITVADPAELIAKLQAAQDEREKFISELNEIKRKHYSLSADIKVKKIELAKISDDGAQLRARAEEIEKELQSVFGQTQDYADRTEKTRAELKAVTQQKKVLTEERDAAQARLAELKGDAKKLEALASSAKSELAAMRGEIEKLAGETGLSSLEECSELYKKFGGTNAEAELEEYDARLAALTAKRDGLSLTEGIDGVSDEMLGQAKAQKEKAAAECESAASGCAVLKNGIDELVKKLQCKAEIEKLLKDCERERNLIYQLKELTKGNKFLEFIANEYLCDISSMASATLIKLTDGRYFLTYKDNGFNVGDNFNCGNLRGVNTLSGGETFLVSLSLALALSQTICSRSNKSIEFFFLDEGFGTLDGSLIDTVLNALEKLKSSDFTIGVISHVEELKHRIDSRITVTKATETRGSAVSLSC